MTFEFIPEPHATYARRVCELSAREPSSLRKRLSSTAGLSLSYVTRLVEDPSIVCIAGERGSGKTTVLATAAAQLASDGHVVIPPIRPEYFAATGSLLATAVAHLQTTVRSDWIDDAGVMDPGRTIELTTAIERTLRQANLVGFEGVDPSGLRADEQAADRSLAASADSDLLDTWQQLVTAVREIAGVRTGAADPLVVIPVDDPDLAPGTLRQILLDLRLLTSADGVVGVTCLDLDEARSVLSDAYAASYRSAPDALLSARVVEAQIAKAFPDDQRVTIRGLVGSERLAFRALDLPLKAIEELCSAYAFGGRHAGDTVATVFRLPSGRPSLYAEALPSNPRDLRGLAYRLAQISPDAPDGPARAAMELCRTAMAHGLKQSGATEASVWPGPLPFEVTSRSEGSPECSLRFDNINVMGVPGARRVMASAKQDEGVEVTLRHDAGVEMQMVTRGRDAHMIQRLHASLSYAVLLVREFSHYYDAIDCHISGPTPIRGGNRPSSYFAVRLDGHRTDDEFLNAPAWEAYFDYFVLDDALGELVPVATAPHNLPDHRLAIEAFVLDFWYQIVSIQRGRRPTEDPARVSRGVRRSDEAAARAFIEQELVTLFSAVDGCFDEQARRESEREVRATDFRHWVEVGLAQVGHPRLVRPSFVARLLELRARSLERRQRRAVADAELAKALEGRVKAKLDEPWVEGLVQLAGVIDDELGTILDAQHRAAVASVERARKRLLGGQAMGALSSGEDEGNQPSARAMSDFDIAMSALDDIEAETRAEARRAAP